MKVILIMVSSVDGKITKWEDGDTYKWTSRADKKHFQSVVWQSNLIVMGSKTFEIARPKPKKGVLRIVMTKNPKHFSSSVLPGQLEFTSEDPKPLVTRLARQGYKRLLLVGGGAVNTSFFQLGLVDELWLTIEPRIFGKGKMLVSEQGVDIKLKLISFEKLNEQGTLLLRYVRVAY